MIAQSVEALTPVTRERDRDQDPQDAGSSPGPREPFYSVILSVPLSSLNMLTVSQSPALGSLRYFTCRYPSMNHDDQHHNGPNSKVKVKGQGHFRRIPGHDETLNFRVAFVGSTPNLVDM